MGFLATMGAGVIDPINFIPVGGVAYKTYRAGGSILRNAMVTGAAGAASMTASEAVFHQTELTRTYGESATNIAAGAMLAGVLGGGIAAFTKHMGGGYNQLDDVIKAADRDMDMDQMNQGGGSTGAAATADLPTEVVAAMQKEVDGLVAAGKLDPADAGADLAKRIHNGQLKFEGIGTNTAMRAVMKVVGRQDPIMRGLGSEGSLTMRRVTPQMAEIPLSLNKNQFGEATPVSAQALTRNWEANKYRALKGLDESYIQYTKGRSKRFGDIAIQGVGNLLNRSREGRKLTFKEFRIQIGQAMRRGDAHEISEVAAAAKMFRKEVYDPLLKEAVELKLLPEDVDPKTAAGYVNRVYNVEKLADRAEREAFKSTTVEWMLRRQEQSAQRVDAFDAKAKSLKNEIASLEESRIQALTKEEIPDISKKIGAKKKELKALDKQQQRDVFDVGNTKGDFDDIAEQIIDRITGTPAGRLSYDMGMPSSRKRKVDPELSGPFKQRVFLIEDELIEPWLE